MLSKYKDVECQKLQHMVKEAQSNKPHTGMIVAVNDKSSVQGNVPSQILKPTKLMNCTYLKIVGMNLGN